MCPGILLLKSYSIHNGYKPDPEIDMAQQQSPTRTITIVGFGIAGQLLLLELLKAGVKGSEITVLDKSFLGGDLVTEYGTVLSNTPWWKTKRALEVYPDFSAAAIAEGNAEFQDAQCMPVGRIGDLCFSVSRSALQNSGVESIVTEIQSIQQTENGAFQIQHTFGNVSCAVLFATQGASPKRLPIDLPLIPLSVALDKELLKRHVSPTKDHIAVIGTAHSGSILLSHLNALSIPTTAFHKGVKPFRFARDGAYDGLKECSEQIADTILRGEYTNLTIVSLDTFFEAHKALKKATKAIVATGFEPRQIQGLPTSYDPKSATLLGWTSAYGFGIAYPGTTDLEGKTYVDVSVLSFQDQIQRCLPEILNTNKTKLHIQ